MNYCNNCGHPVEFTQIEGDNLPRHYCHNCGMIHYKNPKMVVGCLTYYKDKILLCKRAIDPLKGKWNVPAGYLENGESADEGAERETWEEARAKVEIEGIHVLYSLPHINQVYVHFRARLLNLDFEAGEESLEVKLFNEDEIPWKEMAFSSSSFAIQKYFNDKKHSEHRSHIGELVKS